MYSIYSLCCVYPSGVCVPQWGSGVRVMETCTGGLGEINQIVPSIHLYLYAFSSLPHSGDPGFRSSPASSSCRRLQNFPAVPCCHTSQPEDLSTPSGPQRPDTGFFWTTPCCPGKTQDPATGLLDHVALPRNATGPDPQQDTASSSQSLDADHDRTIGRGHHQRHRTSINQQPGPRRPTRKVHSSATGPGLQDTTISSCSSIREAITTEDAWPGLRLWIIERRPATSCSYTDGAAALLRT